MSKISSLKEELVELERRFNKEKQFLEEKIKNELSPQITEKEKKLATYLHDMCCTMSHDDQCDWFYDDGSWNRYSRQVYLKKANKLLKITEDLDLLMKIIRIVK